MLLVSNLYPKKIWVTIMYYAPGCSVEFMGSEPWKKRGWWSLLPGEVKNVFGADLADVNRYYCYFAQASDGSVWAGPYQRLVQSASFHRCSGMGVLGPTLFPVGYRLLDIEDNDDYLLVLHA